MKKTKNSLGGQNNHGRMSGARSSRASSTIFKQLQKLDRHISKLTNQIVTFCGWSDFVSSNNKKIKEQIKKLDLKRKEVRFKRKKYEHI